MYSQVSAGSAEFDRKTRTVSPSAQLVRPLIRPPFAVTEKAVVVVARFMRWLNRTDTCARRATLPVPDTGRKRTTFGARTVRTARPLGTPTSAPSASLNVPSSVTWYSVLAASGASGSNVRSLASPPAGRTKLPSMAGEMRKALAAAATSTGWSKVIRNAVRTSAARPFIRVAAIRANVGVRVTKATRNGAPSWWPARSAAVLPIVIV
jgi:hypothetical protein